MLSKLLPFRRSKGDWKALLTCHAKMATGHAEDAALSAGIDARPTI